MKYFTLIQLEEAIEILLSKCFDLIQIEKVELSKAIHRIAAEDIITCIDQPPFNRSPLDGYAVNHLDIENTCKERPKRLKVSQFISAGDMINKSIIRGEAAMITTGAPLPKGATCVIKQEDTDGGKSEVNIYKSLNQYENFCWKGEDVEKGILLINKGQRLDEASIAVLAGQGYREIPVFSHPKIGILSTGSELILPGEELISGKIFDSNSYYLAARTEQIGGIAVKSKNVADNPEELAKTIEELIKECELVITTGGVSVGACDYMPKAGEILKATKLFHGISVKPGGPAMAMLKDDKIILCLSGTPFAAAATFELLGTPVIKRLCGYREVSHERIKGILQNDFSKASPGRRFVRAKIRGNEITLPNGHAAGSMASMIGCNCLVDIPAGSDSIKAGEEVEAILFK